MNFELSEEQQLLKDSALRFIADHYDFRDRRKLVASKDGFSEKNWEVFAKLGWLALGFDEAFGGIPDADVEIMLLAEAFGRGLVAEPFYSTVVVCGGLLRAAGSQAQKHAILPELVSGRVKLAFAYAEPQCRYDPCDISTAVTYTGDGFVLSGRKVVVFDAPSADYLIVTARIREMDGISLFLVPASGGGIRKRDFVTTDGRRASEVEFSDLRLASDALIGDLGSAAPVVEEVFDRAVAAACADAVGAMDFLFSATLSYLKTRKQFGVTIGSFQVLQHRMVDMYVSLELARSMAIYATLSLGGAAAERSKAVSLAKVVVIEAARLIGRQSIQLHGGIGMTNEYHVGHYFKRLIAFETQFGDTDDHAERLEAIRAI